jgi:tetratricopeptide (TPR) repeat protein
MVSGRPPFQEATRIDTLHAILRDPTPKLAGVGGDVRDALQPIVDRCLQKEPDQRYATMAEALEALKAARGRLESASRLSPAARFGLVTACLAAAAALALALASRRPSEPEESRAPSVAVLPFENLSGESELDWLSTGLSEMLATDLSQTPALEVVGLGELLPMLAEAGAIEGEGPTPELVDEIASRTGVRSVLTGTIERADGAIRVSARLSDARNGRVLLSENVEAEDEENLFRLVDEISARVQANFGLAPSPERLDGDLRNVTTASVAAYREYAEGIRFHERYREEEAAPHFQRAIELDPEFAMAHAKLGVVMSNLGRHEEADQHAEQALRHVDRLSERERLYIEGWYYSRKPATMGRAIEAYRRAVEMYPDHGSARHNLGNLLFTTERYDEAIEQLEELRARGMMFPATYEQLAQAYRALDDVESAREVLREFSERNPDDWTTLLALAQIDIDEGNAEPSARGIDRAQALGAPAARVLPVRWEAHILAEEWDQARETAASLMESDEEVEKFVGGRMLVTTALYRGKADSVLRALDRYLASSPPGGSDYRTQPTLLKARVLLEVGDYGRAREAALSVSELEDHHGASRAALVIAAIAAAKLGDRKQAEELTREYRRRIDPALGIGPERLYHFLEGELAMERRSYEDAVSEFEEAESMLPPGGVEAGHALLWYSLATAHRMSGNEDEAASWYQRVIDSREERLLEPLPYVKSFYYLGKLREEEGDLEGAKASYRRFLDHFEEGDLDRDLVRKAEEAFR